MILDSGCPRGWFGGCGCAGFSHGSTLLSSASLNSSGLQGGTLTPLTVRLWVPKTLAREAPGLSTSTRLTLLLGFTRSLLAVQPAAQQQVSMHMG